MPDLHTVARGHLSVRVGDTSWCSEEIVKNLELRLSVRSLFLLLNTTTFILVFLKRSPPYIIMYESGDKISNKVNG